ncbi:hypothetical protein LshimejAT787_1702070 [Lyophyllum shimeji]|uniref:Uncharacterized protein n=1 Tax=Lyophyllum shimeji TaxID=47721 RepID=A0A9P3PX10_LYOSH|nr:hypothetical protein LshimejAT787_1702070 [Lyophyllum shimeji]
MSGAVTDTNFTNPDTAPSAQPGHRLHDSSEPLPGVKGAAPTNDYTPGTMDRTPSSRFRNEERSTHVTHAASSHGQGKNAFNSERPLDVQPTEAGGVAVGGRPDLPEGQAGLGDKMIGKTQKVLGKFTNNPEMHEKGELKEAGGKAAARGEARAPHD